MPLNRADHAAIHVEDLGKAVEWYEGVLGLTVLQRSATKVDLACRGDATDLTLIAGGKSIESFAFGVDHADDLDGFALNLSRHDVPHKRFKVGDRPGTDEILSFALPSGHRMELVVGAGGRVAGRTETVSDGTYRPTDFDHVNLLGEADPEKVSTFLRSVLGFNQSLALTMGGAWAASWLRSTPRDHDLAYMQAFRPSDRLHHVAFAMEDGNHYFRLGDRLIETGHRFEYGPGRHMAGLPRDTIGFGTNLFAYAFDPSGNRNEFSGGMCDFPDDASYIAETDVEALGEIMNGWAKNMPETFMTQGT